MLHQYQIKQNNEMVQKKRKLKCTKDQQGRIKNLTPVRSTLNWSQGLLSADADDASPLVTKTSAATGKRLRDAASFNKEALLSSLRATHALATRTGAASFPSLAAAAAAVDDGSSTPNIAAVKGAGADAASCGLPDGRTEGGFRLGDGDGSRRGDGNCSRFDDDDGSRLGDGDGSRRGDGDGCRRGDSPCCNNGGEPSPEELAVGPGLAFEAGCFRGDSSAKAAASNASIWGPFPLNDSPPLPPPLLLLRLLLLLPPGSLSLPGL